MLHASQGVRAATRKAPNILAHSHAGPSANGGIAASRSLHFSSFRRIPTQIPQPGVAQKLFTQSRNLLAQFFNHLTAPGLRLPSTPSASRSLHGTSLSTKASIQNGLSFPTRVALSRPLQPFHLPRPPIVPRSVAQVGLGTARNFSSARPIFQNLVENVPIAGRAFYEADWEIKMQKEKENMRKFARTSSSTKKSSRKEKMKPRDMGIVGKENVLPSESANDVAELDEYFPKRAVPAVTTCLLVPLAPTPTTRVPLSQVSPTDTSLLPLSVLASTHGSYDLHSLRVSTLFTRLDVANVWERGVQCSAFSHGGGGMDGVCTMLKLEFIGWTKAEVRAVLGESGTGWCVLEERRLEDEENVRLPFEDEEDDSLSSDNSSVLSGALDDDSDWTSPSMSEVVEVVADIDPAQSFILPTLDVSDISSAPLSVSSPSLMPSMSHLESFSPTHERDEFDPWSEISSDSESDSFSVYSGTESFVDPPSINGYFAFSSQYLDRATSTNTRPREAMFY